MVIRMAIEDMKLSQEWKDALKSRMSKERIDSFGGIQRSLSDKELEWKKTDRIPKGFLERLPGFLASAIWQNDF